MTGTNEVSIDEVSQIVLTSDKLYIEASSCLSGEL